MLCALHCIALPAGILFNLLNSNCQRCLMIYSAHVNNRHLYYSEQTAVREPGDRAHGAQFAKTAETAAVCPFGLYFIGALSQHCRIAEFFRCLPSISKLGAACGREADIREPESTVWGSPPDRAGAGERSWKIHGRSHRCWWQIEIPQ
jgi:hypothetical protein